MKKRRSKTSLEITQMRKPFCNGGVIYFEGGLKVSATSYARDRITVRIEKGKLCKSVQVEISP